MNNTNSSKQVKHRGKLRCSGRLRVPDQHVTPVALLLLQT